MLIETHAFSIKALSYYSFHKLKQPFHIETVTIYYAKYGNKTM